MNRDSSGSGGSRAPTLITGALVTILTVAITIAVSSQAPLRGVMAHGYTAVHPDIEIPGHTGGFGEPTCQACHFDNDLNDSRGVFEVKGFPESVTADSTYRIEIILTHPELRAGGFQLTVRTENGDDAGKLSPPDDRVSVVEHRGVTYAGHTLTGTVPSAGNQSRWHVDWIPSSDAEAVLHAVGNAANGDRSEFGDFIFVTERRAAPDKE